MRAITTTVGLLFLAVFITAGSAFAGGESTLYESGVYDKNMTGNVGIRSEAVSIYEDWYEPYGPQTEKQVTARSAEKEANRQFGIEPLWE